jgi:hypothetical protein
MVNANELLLNLVICIRLSENHFLYWKIVELYKRNMHNVTFTVLLDVLNFIFSKLEAFNTAVKVSAILQIITLFLAVIEA